jgi:DNA polymerase zeta
MDNLFISQILNARQLALKLIANVTYGYTAAGFSGRMPCAELADSIVQCGRRTLETAISFVNQHPLWNARVVYGDNDRYFCAFLVIFFLELYKMIYKANCFCCSLFVLLKGRSREEAFRIGKEIASLVTAINPDPVTLKFEKVYHPCFLLTKKRYVGYSYESPEQNEPIFDAKGIETVRRDTCPAVAKMLERSLRIMFEEQDLVKVRHLSYSPL